MTFAMANTLKGLGRKFRREAVQPSAPDVVPNKPLPMVGLFALLTEDQKIKALSAGQDESFGPNEFRRTNGC